MLLDVAFNFFRILRLLLCLVLEIQSNPSLPLILRLSPVFSCLYIRILLMSIPNFMI